MIIAINMHFPDVVKSNENILYLLGQTPLIKIKCALTFIKGTYAENNRSRSSTVHSNNKYIQ
jgi:hypothetical protein